MLPWYIDVLDRLHVRRLANTEQPCRAFSDTSLYVTCFATETDLIPLAEVTNCAISDYQRIINSKVRGDDI